MRGKSLPLHVFSFLPYNTYSSGAASDAIQHITKTTDPTKSKLKKECLETSLFILTFCSPGKKFFQPKLVGFSDGFLMRMCLMFVAETRQEHLVYSWMRIRCQIKRMCLEELLTFIILLTLCLV